MNKEAMQAWVDELMFGDHTQTYGELKNDEGAFCAMGVACIAYGKAHKQRAPFGSRLKNGDFYWQPTEAPEKVTNWLGISDVVEKEVVALNDLEEMPLPNIGTWLRDNYLKEE